jgi:hypothetical protein
LELLACLGEHDQLPLDEVLDRLPGTRFRAELRERMDRRSGALSMDVVRILSVSPPESRGA